MHQHHQPAHPPPVRLVNVRAATLGDELVLRELRLQALTDAPEAFGSTYDCEVARTAAQSAMSRPTIRLLPA